MPMPSILKHFQPLLPLFSSQLTEDLLTPFQRRRLIETPRNNQHRTLDSGVVRGSSKLNSLAIRDIALRALREEHFTNESFLQRSRRGPGGGVGDRVGHGFHAGGLDDGDAVFEYVGDGGSGVDGADKDSGCHACGLGGGEVGGEHAAH